MNHTTISVLILEVEEPVFSVLGIYPRTLVSFPLIASIVLTNMLMQTIRKPVRANIVAAARSGLFFIPLIFILPYFFGLLGVEMCQMWADCCSFAVAVPIAWSAFRDMRREQMELWKSH